MDLNAQLRISEVFTSIQGEAATTGYPTTFIRLTGCPLRCDYCDSEYAFKEGSRYTINYLLEECRKAGVKHVCVTGGEPLAQPNCLKLLTVLCEADFIVSLETSGAFDIEGIDDRVSIVMDIKTPDSCESDKNRLTNLDLIQFKDQIKVVICSESDFRWFELFCSNQPNVFNAGIIWISPSHNQMNLKRLADLVIKSQYPFRLQLQLHKQIWGEEPSR